MINTKLDCGNFNPEGQEMGGLWDSIVSAVNTPKTKAAVQSAIDANKQKAIDAGIAAASKAAASVLNKTGATDPKSLATISKVVGAATQGAQDSFWAANKNKIYIASGVLALGIGALIYMKMKK